MAKNKIEDLRDHLFETIEMLKSKEIDIETAKVITEVGQVIVNSAKTEVDFMKVVGGIGEGSGFIPLEERKQKALGGNKDKKDREDEE